MRAVCANQELVLAMEVASDSDTTASCEKTRRRGFRLPDDPNKVFRADSVAQPPVRPTPQPTRPKGRWLAAVFLLTFCGILAFAGWDTFLRYTAYGVIDGDVIAVSTPIRGLVGHVYVGEGQRVEKGQLLLTVENFEATRKLDRLNDDLRIAQATLEAELSKVKWHLQGYSDRIGRAKSDYFQLWGELLDEQEQLELLRRRLKRLRELQSNGVVSDDQIEETRSAEASLQKKIDKLIPAVEELKVHTELGDLEANEGYDQLKPSLARIHALQSEIRRLRVDIDRGRVHAPVSGTIVKLHCSPGETLDEHFHALEILKEGTLEVVLYVPQSDVEKYPLEGMIELEHLPDKRPLAGTIEEYAIRYEDAPPQVARFYRDRQKLLPIRISPNSEEVSRPEMRLGAVVCMPRSWRPTL